MRMQIESTEQITDLGGIQARVWKGYTEAGVECLVFVHRIAVANSQDQAQFEKELIEQLPPGRAVPLREVL